MDNIERRLVRFVPSYSKPSAAVEPLGRLGHVTVRR